MSAEVIKQDWPSLEAALESLREHMARIKELEAQIEQMKNDKPVAWMDSSGHPKHLRHIQGSEERRLYGKLQPLYLHPQPKREWVGLTDKERKDIIRLTPPRAYLSPNDWTNDMLTYIEAKLKEKNT